MHNMHNIFAKPFLKLGILGFQLLNTLNKPLAFCNPFLIIMQVHFMR